MFFFNGQNCSFFCHTSYDISVRWEHPRRHKCMVMSCLTPLDIPYMFVAQGERPEVPQGIWGAPTLLIWKKKGNPPSELSD